MVSGGVVKTLELDVSAVSYIDSFGITALDRVMNLLQQKNGRLVLSKCGPVVKKIIDIVKSGAHRGVFASWSELDKYLYSLQSAFISTQVDATA